MSMQEWVFSAVKKQKRRLSYWRNGAVYAIALVSLGLVFMPITSMAVDMVFTPTDDFAFGAPGNPKIGDFQGVTQFDGRLFVSAESTSEDAQIWSSATGESGSWRHDVADGFASAGAVAGTNASIGVMEVFGGRLYAGTINTIDGFQLWRWDGVVANPWEPIAATGIGPVDSQFGQGPGLVSSGITASHVSGGALFLGTRKSATIWRSIDGLAWTAVTDVNFSRADDSTVHDLIESGGHIYAAVSGDAVGTADVWRCAIATSCDDPSEWFQVFDASTPGVTLNQYIRSLYAFNGFIYAAGDSGSVYRCLASDCNEQADWSAVTQNGFGEGAALLFSEQFSYAGVMYSFADHVGGVKMWRSVDGVHFTSLSPDGFSTASETVMRHIDVLNNRFVLSMDHLLGIRPKIADLDPVLVTSPFVDVRNDGSGLADVQVVFGDPDITDSGRLRVEYSTNGGGSWNVATISAQPAHAFASNGGLGVNNAADHQIGTAAGGYINARTEDPTVTFAWNMTADLAPGRYDQLQVRVTPYDGIADGASRISNIVSFVVRGEDRVIPDPVEISDIDVRDVRVLPDVAKEGTILSIGFTVDGDIEGIPTVRVDGFDAQYERESVLGPQERVYVYRYAVQGPDHESEGTVDVVVDVQSVSGDTDTDIAQLQLDFSPPAVVIAPAAGQFESAQNIFLRGSDANQFSGGQGSGIEAIYVTVNDPDISTRSNVYAAPFSLGEGEWTVRWFAVDRAGNQSDVQQATYQIGDAAAFSEDGCDPNEDPNCYSPFAFVSGEVFLERLLGNRALVSVPVAVAALALSIANIALAAAQIASYMRYLWQLFSEPLRWLAGKRRASWGVVVDKLSGLPLDLVTVRLIDVQTGRSVQTSVTDSSGRFLFVGEPGEYRVEAVKTGYTPLDATSASRESALTLSSAGQQTYSGQIINIDDSSDEGSVINLRVELSRIEGLSEIAHSTKPVWLSLTSRTAWDQAPDTAKREDDKRIRDARFWRRFAHVLSFIGPSVGLFILWFDPSWLHAVLFVVHILLFLLFRRLARKKEGSPWGRVKDLTTGRPLSGAIVRLFDEKHGRLLLSRITSQSGQYGFLVGDGGYTLSGQKEGYTSRRPFISVSAGVDTVVNEDISMRKRSVEGG